VGRTDRVGGHAHGRPPGVRGTGGDLRKGGVATDRSSGAGPAACRRTYSSVGGIQPDGRVPAWSVTMPPDSGAHRTSSRPTSRMIAAIRSGPG
jgi:hypothetical protein